MSRLVSVPIAQVTFNEHGIPYSTEFADIYHPAAGADAQARHVFLAGNDLPGRWQDRGQFTILETGFGLGLNFLETWRALEEDARAPQRLHFVSVESRPLARDAMAGLHARWPEHALRSRELCAGWPAPLAGFHRIFLAHDRIVLTLLLGDAADMLPQLEARADALFLDGFTPSKNPQLWSQDVFTELARLAAPGATLATWTVAAPVRDGLAAAGFVVEKRRGLGNQREMLACRKPAGAGGIAGMPKRRTAFVIGAGIAGCTVAERLAARGWQVDVLDTRNAPAQGASGNPLALASPLVNFSDESNARLSRAAFLFARRWYASLGGPVMAASPGVLRIARNERDAMRFAQLLERLGYPPDFASFADLSEGRRLTGHAVSRAGLWFPDGMTISPADACIAALARWPDRIHLRHSVPVDHIVAVDGDWRAMTQRDDCVAQASIAILACGNGMRAFSEASHLPLEAIRGQVTLLPAHPMRCLDVAVSGDRHAANLPDGRCMIGATFQPGDEDRSLRPGDHAQNMASVDDMLPGFCDDISSNSPQLGGRTEFRAVTPDRLPVFGALAGQDRSERLRSDSQPRPEGLFIAGGLGARGIVWAPLGAELIAAQLNGEPLPVSRELAQAMHPGRFDKPRGR